MGRPCAVLKLCGWLEYDEGLLRGPFERAYLCEHAELSADSELNEKRTGTYVGPPRSAFATITSKKLRRHTFMSVVPVSFPPEKVYIGFLGMTQLNGDKSWLPSLSIL
jgi:hypothetical protein